MMYPAAIPFCYFIILQQIEIFVAAVHECYIVFEIADFLEQLLLLPGAVPEKTEVSAYQQGVSCTELFQPGVLEAGKITVHITGYIDHEYVPPHVACAIFALLDSIAHFLTGVNIFFEFFSKKD